MNIYAIINGINSVISLGIVVVIFLSKSRKPIQIIYAFFSLLLFLWAFSYFIWGFQSDLSRAMFWLNMTMYPTCFIHTGYLHFVLIITDKLKKYRRSLFSAYLTSAILVVLQINNFFIDDTKVRHIASFPFWPHASPMLIWYLLVQIYFVLLGHYILFRSIKTSEEPLKIRLKYFLIVGTVGWSGGLINWFSWYDAIQIPPIGNIAVTFYMITVTYLIFRHNLLGLNLVIKKAFVYTLLTAFIAAVYALFIIVSERLFQSVVGYSSIVASILAAFTITLLFNPIRSILAKSMDKLFFGKDIQELSDENMLLREELLKQDRLKAVATFASGMAHEIKNPLTSIKTFAEYLPQKYDDPEFRSKFNKIVSSEVDRVNHIIKQLLEFSKPQEPALQRENICSILDDTLELLTSHLLKNHIEAHRSYPKILLLFIDRNQLKQAFLNIFLNSIQAMPNGGKLFVSLEIKGSSDVVILIKDTGAGISKEELPHIFDPFHTTKEAGTGLGLSIVHSIIEKHGGKIKVESAVGRGTTISVILKNRSSYTPASKAFPS